MAKFTIEYLPGNKIKRTLFFMGKRFEELLEYDEKENDVLLDEEKGGIEELVESGLPGLDLNMKLEIEDMRYLNTDELLELLTRMEKYEKRDANGYRQGQ